MKEQQVLLGTFQSLCLPLPVFWHDFDWQLNEHVTMRNEHMCFEAFPLKAIELYFCILQCQFSVHV